MTRLQRIGAPIVPPSFHSSNQHLCSRFNFFLRKALLAIRRHTLQLLPAVFVVKVLKYTVQAFRVVRTLYLATKERVVFQSHMSYQFLRQAKPKVYRSQSTATPSNTMYFLFHLRVDKKMQLTPHFRVVHSQSGIGHMKLILGTRSKLVSCQLVVSVISSSCCCTENFITPNVLADDL